MKSIAVGEEISSPLFSIITVVFNGEGHIEETIQSVLSQTYGNYEYIIIDGLSTDNTVNIIKIFEKRITYWISEPDEGIYDAMNKGWRVAAGEYVYFLNSDDYFSNNAVLSSAAKFACVAGNCFDVLSGQVKLDYGEYSILREQKYEMKALRKAKMPPHQGFFCKTKLMEKVGGFDTAYSSSSDINLMIQVLLEKPMVCYLPFTVAAMRAGGASSNKAITYKETAKILKKHFGYFPYIRYYLRKVFLEQRIKRFLTLVFPKSVFALIRRAYIERDKIGRHR